MPESPPIVLAITGASGAPYAVRLLEMLATNSVSTWLLVSSHGWRLLAEECGIKDESGLKKATGGQWASVRVFNDGDRGAQPASGSVKTQGMVVCPCSMGTMAAIAHGTSRSLIERAADVTLKERRKLVLVPRETPLSLVHLRNLVLAAEAGAVILPAAPGFYQRPKEVGQLVDFVVQRILDHLDLGIALLKPWQG
ncbi:MAG TPA: flavin prenyltransferase UbiX [Gemmatimonadales bacterium]|nr:flavin prenyltransferase UbiX [Gemmatimonadales bacterium]